MINILVYICLGGFIVFGFFFMMGGIKEIKLAKKSSSWPTTMGTIIESRIETSSDSDGETYRPSVRFSYQVHGLKFTGNKIFFGHGGIYSSNYNYSKKVVTQYSTNKIITIYYNPSQPKQSVIEAGIKLKTFSQFAFGSLFFIIGLGALIGYTFYR